MWMYRLVNMLCLGAIAIHAHHYTQLAVLLLYRPMFQSNLHGRSLKAYDKITPYLRLDL